MPTHPHSPDVAAVSFFCHSFHPLETHISRPTSFHANGIVSDFTLEFVPPCRHTMGRPPVLQSERLSSSARYNTYKGTHPHKRYTLRMKGTSCE